LNLVLKNEDLISYYLYYNHKDNAAKKLRHYSIYNLLFKFLSN